MKIQDEDFLFRLFDALDTVDSHGDLFWHTYPPDGVRFYLICNDFFYWATADLEEVTSNNIEVLEQAIKDLKALSGNHEFLWATLLFCARVRKMRPQQPAYPKEPELRALFDACGPERSRDDEG